VLDEATSALDAESEALVQAALDTLVADRTTLVIAHRLSTIVRADSIVCLAKGRVAGAGAHAELLRACPEYAALVRRQLRSAGSGVDLASLGAASAAGSSAAPAGAHHDDADPSAPPARAPAVAGSTAARKRPVVRSSPARPE
jgi:ABC-type multidrug transport system ATPase subunit